MVANESEALRWVARQWERRIETDVILNVYEAREPKDKLDRATDKTLAEADRKALHGLCR